MADRVPSEAKDFERNQNDLETLQKRLAKLQERRTALNEFARSQTDKATQQSEQREAERKDFLRKKENADSPDPLASPKRLE
ncbi:MAG TPA: hypothetical protein VEH27_04535 [Methylomirabilota bacterium]|nr:hypothetical protein [Methylomirabilota bacterium]